MMLTKWLGGILIFLIGIQCGFTLLSFIISFENLKISEEVGMEFNPIGFLNLIATIVLAFYVTRILSRQNNKESQDAELINNYLLSFKDDLNLRFSNLSSEDKHELIKLTSDCKIIRSRLHSICDLCDAKGLVRAENESIVQIKESVRKVWELLTDTPKKIDGRANKATKDGLRTLQKEKLSQVRYELVKIEQLIFKIVLEVNQKSSS